MITPSHQIDIKESILRRTGAVLDILLIDRTTKKNIIWATDSYEPHGEEFSKKNHITSDLVTGSYHSLIQPRAAKSPEEQRKRTKEKAEVFTSLKIVDQMNRSLESAPLEKETWQSFVRERRLEITCGEAPFIVTRYNPTSHTGKLIKVKNRVGFLDRKLRAVSKFVDSKNDWIFWAKEAFQASYGYEWQGDNILLARENLFSSFLDYYQEKFNQRPSLKIQEEFAYIISWNIFQMDGLRCVIPMSCRHESIIFPPEFTLFGEIPGKVEKHECEGCKYNNQKKHNGRYVKIMDWEKNKSIKFVDLVQTPHTQPKT